MPHLAFADRLTVFVWDVADRAMEYDAGTTTRENLQRTGYARAMLRTTDPAFKKGYDRFGNVGSRLLLKLIDDAGERRRLYNENREVIQRYRGMSEEDCVFLRIVEVYPLG